MGADAVAGAARRRFIVPEVVQISNMDCGPASLKCLLDGHGIRVNYGRLREACQTDLDGTSIDTIEQMAVQLGLAAEQVLLPADYLSLPEGRCLPAIVVVRLPTGATHFVVVWRRHGRLLQIMDPAGGRRWVSVQRLLDDVHEHVHAVRAASWRRWAGSEEFRRVLRARMARIGTGRDTDRLCRVALGDPGWRSIAALDAAVRMTDVLVRSGGLRRGREAGRVVDALYRRALEESPGECEAIPARYWSVRPATGPESSPRAEEWLAVRGVVMLRVVGALAVAGPRGADLSPELAAAIEIDRPATLGRLWGLMREDGVLSPVPLSAALAVSACGIIVEGIVLRSLLEVSGLLGWGGQRALVISALVSYAVILAILDVPLTATGFRAGRALEARLRIAFLSKITRLRDRYFHSRLVSDMVERGHSIHLLRTFPPVAIQLVRAAMTVAVLTAGIAWLDPRSTLWVLAIAGVSVGIPLAGQSVLGERDLRVRTHAAALVRFYLDGMLGLLAIRSCAAERLLRREQEGVVAEWVRAGLRLQRAALSVQTLGAVLTYGLIAAVLIRSFMRAPDAGSMLLLVYWILALPAAAQEFAGLALQYPAFRNTAERVFEPLDAPENPPRRDEPAAEPLPVSGPAAIAMDGVSVRVAGHTILEDVTISIAAGAHVAVVGPSGAGKTTLLGLLLGWHEPAQGQVRVDGASLSESNLDRLRADTAWVDPTVQIWNAPLLANLLYGIHESDPPVGGVLAEADLEPVVAKAPEGLQSPLGENGARISGGEGQRVRLGRALMRPDARLVILDEPLRGLDREQRRELLSRIRAWWRGATLICVTHDASEARSFDRVVVMNAGRVVEDDRPENLAGYSESWFSRMLAEQSAVREALDAGGDWRRYRLVRGRLEHVSTAEGSA